MPPKKEKRTIAQLRKEAEKRGIKLGSLRLKADILAAVEKKESKIWKKFRQIDFIEGILAITVLYKKNQVFLLFNDGTHDRDCLSSYCERKRRTHYTVIDVIKQLAIILATEKKQLPFQHCLDVFLEEEVRVPTYSDYYGYCPEKLDTGHMGRIIAETTALAVHQPNLRVHRTDRRQDAPPRHESFYGTMDDIARAMQREDVRLVETLKRRFWPEGALAEIKSQLLEIPGFAKIAKQGAHTYSKEYAQKLLENEIAIVERKFAEGNAHFRNLNKTFESYVALFRQGEPLVKNGRPGVPKYLLEPADVLSIWLIAVRAPKARGKPAFISEISNYFTEEMIYLGTLFTDVYGFVRAMKTFDVSIKNRKCQDSPQVRLGIIHAGDIHIDRWLQWLQSPEYGFKIAAATEGPDGKRCVPFAPIAKWIADYCATASHCFGSRH
jgi:hypothetical protein